MSILLESVKVECSQPGLVHVDHTQVLESGLDMGRELLLSRDNAAWLAQTVRRYLESYDEPRVEESRGDDHFKIFERGQEPTLFIHIRNVRVDGWKNSIVLSRHAAESLVEQLESL